MYRKMLMPVNIASLIILHERFFWRKFLLILWILYGKQVKAILAMINFKKELHQNTTVVQSEHTEQYSKGPMKAPSGGSPWCPQWILDSNGQQSTVLHASVMPFFVYYIQNCNISVTPKSNFSCFPVPKRLLSSPNKYISLSPRKNTMASWL